MAKAAGGFDRETTNILGRLETERIRLRKLLQNNRITDKNRARYMKDIDQIGRDINVVKRRYRRKTR